MGITPKELAEILTKLSYTSVVSFEELWVGSDREDGQSAIGSIKDERAEDPAETRDAPLEKGFRRERRPSSRCITTKA